MTVDELQARRVELLVEQIGEILRTNRGANFKVENVGSVAELRMAARIAGRRLGIPVRTGMSRDGATVWVSEGP